MKLEVSARLDRAFKLGFSWWNRQFFIHLGPVVIELLFKKECYIKRVEKMQVKRG